MQVSESLYSLEKGKRYLVAVSGGVDSMVLLYLFINSGLSFSVAHCNFRLRGEASDLDEELVTNVCKKNNIKLYKTSFDTLSLKKSRESVEMLARSLRYSFFKEIMNNESVDYLVTAHQLNDKAETFFINLLRGSGIKGLASIQEENRNILRPLLRFSRSQISDFAQENKIIWREDASNQTLDYLRNKIRHQVIPELEKINSRFLIQAEKSMNILHSTQQYIEREVQRLKEETAVSKNVFSQEKLKQADFILVYNLFAVYGFTSEEEIKKILQAETGKLFSNAEYTVFINRGTLIIESTEELKEEAGEFIIKEIPYQLSEPLSLQIEFTDQYVALPDREFVDYDKLIFPLVIRRWKEGDYFHPINGNGRKKLSKFLKDLKLSVPEKQNVWVLCNGNGNIIWVIGFRLDHRFKINNETKKNIVLKK